MKVKFLGSKPVAHNIRSFEFERPAGVKQIAGQFIEMTLPHDNPDDRGIKRWFTVSAAPSEDHLAITTKWAGDKASSFKKYLFNDLKPGTEVEMVEPDGDFTLPDDPQTKIVFIAGGIGVTPLHSMVQWLKDQGEKRDITLLYGVQNEDELAFMDLFKAYGVDVRPKVNERFTAESLMKEIGDPAGKLVYVSGPEPMVEALTESLVKAGLPEKQLKSDYFPGYTNEYSN